MAAFMVEGGYPLYGSQRVSGAKNAALPILAAALICPGQVRLYDCPRLRDVENMLAILRELGADITGDPHMDIREYIRDMADCLAAADLVICRSGAMTLTELEAAGRASILIPSPNVAENHQYHNAMVLAEHGAAVVIEEKDLTGERLCQTIEELLSDPARLTELGKKAASLARLDANERISREILELAQEPAKA